MPKMVSTQQTESNLMGHWVKAHNGKEWVNLDHVRIIKIEETDLGQPKRYTVAAEYFEADEDYPVLLHELSTLEAAQEWVARLLSEK